MRDEEIYNPSVSVALSSSAGSGKTYTLTTRLITMLFSNIKPYEILAITFTKASAKEIRERLLNRIKKIAMGDTEEVDLFKDILGGEAKNIIKKANGLNEEVIKNFSLFQISTIHSYFAKTIKYFPRETSIPLNIRIIDENEKLVFLNEALENFYQYISEKDDWLGRIFDFITSYKEKKLSTRNIFKNIYEIMESNSYLFNSTIINIDKNVCILEKEFKRKRNYLTGKEIEKNIYYLIDICTEYIKNYKGNNQIESFIKKLDEYIYYKNIKSFVKIGPFKKDLKIDISRYLATVLKSLDENVKNKFERSLFIIRNAIFSYLLTEMEYYIYTILDIFLKMKNFYDDLKSSYGVIDFNDIEQISNNFLSIIKDFDYLDYRIDSKIKYVLIDEFQDTSEIQWDAIKHIVKNSLKKGGKLFYVGDVKQSIYRWRGGEPELFEKARKELNIKKKVLKYTYRQNVIILNFVNSVFDTIAKNIYPDYPFEEQFIPEDKIAEKNRGYVLVKQCEDNEKVMEEVLNQIGILREKGVNEGDIAILCRKNREIEEIEKILIKNRIGYISDGKSKLFKDYAIMDMVNILNLVLNPDEGIYLASLLRSPIFGYTYEKLKSFKDEEDKIDLKTLKRLDPSGYERIVYIINHSHYVTPSGFIRMIYEGFDIFNVYQAKIEPLLELYELAYGFEEKYKDITLHDFAKYIKANSELIPLRSRGKEGVILQTIHASKGLEYHAVILPFLNQPFKFNMDNSLIFKKDGSGKMQDYVIAGRDYKDYFSIIPYISSIYEEKDDRYKIDELNILYVAITRAKENLIIIPSMKKKQQTIGDILVSSLNDKYKKGSTNFIKETGSIVSSFESKKAPERLYLAVKRMTHEKTFSSWSSEKDTENSDNKLKRIGKLKGLVFHTAIEKVKTLPVSDIVMKDIILKALALEGSNYTKKEREDAFNLAYVSLSNTLSDIRLKKYFSSSAKGEVDTLSNEYQNLLGRIDRIFIDKDVEVIDFKTNSIKDNSYLNKLAVYYKDQVISYCKSISKIYSDRVVNGYLYFTDALYDERIVSVYDGRKG